ncbi:PsbP-related protein [Methanobacterium alcaliphilum]|uniref:PsbP-related protein n=1 Tax=Methanobacterium alcaliphilum TaxID=392018 RepID=UPI00200A9038|nr:PsbP-related protein [Methanobacterium alcaliphilum]MCK9151473.1 hypothetical protein [Methanobacterium alcaliphilum]
MKKYLPIIVLMVAVIFASGCVDSGDTNQTSNGTNVVPDIPAKTYSQDNITFKYPESWISNLTSTTPNTIAIVGDPDSQDSSGNIDTLAVIQTIALPSGQTLKQTYDATYAGYANMTGYELVSQRTLTIDGVTAYENIHKVEVGGVVKQERATWLEKDGQIYVILCGTLPEDFNSQQTNFDLITYSFQVE